jgi:hypothetical protein
LIVQYIELIQNSEFPQSCQTGSTLRLSFLARRQAMMLNEGGLPSRRETNDRQQSIANYAFEGIAV